MKALVILANFIVSFVLIYCVAEAIVFMSRSTFTFAEAALAGAMWGRAIVFALLLLIGAVAYATVSRREDTISLRNEVREVQNRLGAVHAGVTGLAATPAPSPTYSYRGVRYVLNGDYSITATVNGSAHSWPSLADFGAWVDLSQGPSR